MDARIAHVAVTYDGALDEYIVKAYDAGLNRIPESDYFTPDKEDAWATGRVMVSPPVPSGPKTLPITYHDGYQDGLCAYAWWKDGVQYVGSCGTTLSAALLQKGPRE